MSERTNHLSEELLKLRNDNGVINPADAVKWARRNKASVLHANLEWDDEIAGERYRIWQVRTLIAVHITDAEGGRRFVSLSIDRKHDGSNGYRAISDIIDKPDLRSIMVADALRDLERMQDRYKRLTELQAVWEAAATVRAQRRVKAAA